MERAGLNRFDQIVYINLDHRQDRKEELVAELDKLGVDKGRIHRIGTVFDPLNGHRGCALNHARALQYAIDQNLDNVLVLEDDFVATSSHGEIEAHLSHFFAAVSDAWDVFFLAGNIKKRQKTSFDRIYRVFSSQCGHAYAVNKPYFKTLLSLFLYAYTQMKDDPLFIYSVERTFDQLWDLLMHQDRWYVTEIMAQQRTSYSDIEQRERSRNHYGLSG